MLNKIDISYIKKCFIISSKAEAAPPLGTILGNIGVNTIKFCDEFNLYTKNLPSYFLLKVIIFIYENKTIKFNINKPSVGFLLNILKFEKKIKIKI
jgi:large subunit ribosomal protein L11